MSSGTPSASSTADHDGQTLETLAATVLQRVQTAFADVVEAVPAPTDRPHEIEKALSLHKTLAWKLAKIAESADPVAIYPRIPGPGAVEKVLRAAQRTGVSEDRLERVRSALRELDALIERHAGDRESFEIMLAGLTEEPLEEAEIVYRKDGFRATSHIWGVQARTIFRAVMVHPAADDDRMLDAAVVFGCVDFRRLRAERSWPITRWRPTDDAGNPIPVTREPIDAVEAGRAPLLVENGASPVPEIRRTELDDGTVEDEIIAGPIGNTGALSFFTGEVIRSVMSRYRSDDNQIMAQNLELRTPCRTVVFDHFVPRDLFGRVEPTARVFGELAGRPLYSTLRSNRDQLDVFERVEHLGTGPDAAETPDIPNYPAAVRHVSDRLGWDADDFDVYRLRMLYPYVPATLTYDYPLPRGLDVTRGGAADDARVAWIMRAVIAIAVVAVYLNAVDAAFVFDDVPQIVDRSAELSRPIHENLRGERRPVVTVSLALNHAVGGLDPRGYHVVNIAIHMTAALLLFGLVRRAARRYLDEGADEIAFATALLWAVHPLLTSAVTYVIQRAEALAALCMLAVLYALLRAAGSARPGAWYATAVGACLVGMGSKATMVIAPPLAFLFDGLVLSPSLREAWRRRWGVHLALASTWMILVPTGVLAAAVGTTPDPPAPAAVGLGVAGVTPLEYLATQPGVLLHYAQLAFWPAELCIDYRWPAARSAVAIVPPSTLIALAAVVVLIACWKRYPLAFPGLVIFGWLAPTSSVIPIRDFAAEHRAYLPLAGLILIVVSVAWSLLRRFRSAVRTAIGLPLLAVATTALCGRTVERNRDYASPIAMWTATVETAPHNERARMNLAVALRAEGRGNEALARLAELAEASPGDLRIRLNYGDALLESGRAAEAVPHLTVAANRMPNRADVTRRLGDALRAAGRPGEAAEAYRRANDVAPSAAGWLALGNALADAGRNEEAERAYERAAELAEHDAALRASAQYNIGNLRFRHGDVDGAVTAYRAALAAAPDHEGARHWLAEAERRRDEP